MKRVRDLITDADQLRAELAPRNIALDDFVAHLWAAHSRMKSGDDADNLRAYTKNLEADRLDLKRTVVWLLSISNFLKQLNPSIQDIEIGKES